MSQRDPGGLNIGMDETTSNVKLLLLQAKVCESCQDKSSFNPHKQLLLCVEQLLATLAQSLFSLIQFQRSQT